VITISTTGREYCLATFSVYGPCIRAAGHPIQVAHVDLNTRQFYQARPTTEAISAVLAVVRVEDGPVSRAALARKTGLDLKTATATAEAGARSGHINRARLADGHVYYTEREPGTAPRGMWGES
jgi:hypothetical protein